MRSILLIAVCLLSVAHGRQLLEDGDRPRTPPYEVINSTKSLEVRKYENATWAVAFGRSRWLIDFAAQSAGFELAKYFKGGNVAHTAIRPTFPLVATILRPPPPPRNGSHPHSHHNGTHPHKNGTHPKPPHHKPRPPPGPPAVAIAAYLPFKGDAPIPDSPHVKILQTNTTEVFVHRFGGWALSFVVRHEIGHLSLALKDLGICPRKGKFFVATYNGPFRIFGRRNEILFVKKPKHSHNETFAEEFDAASADLPGMGLEALDVLDIFPEEFPPLRADEAWPEKFDPTMESEEVQASGAEQSSVAFGGLPLAGFNPTDVQTT